jgi:hypothetical protein
VVKKARQATKATNIEKAVDKTPRKRSPKTENACGWLQLWQMWTIAISLVLLKLRDQLRVIRHFPR